MGFLRKEVVTLEPDRSDVTGVCQEGDMGTDPVTSEAET